MQEWSRHRDEMWSGPWTDLASPFPTSSHLISVHPIFFDVLVRLRCESLYPYYLYIDLEQKDASLNQITATRVRQRH